MTTAEITAPSTPVRTTTTGLAVLARLEMRRYVRNPFFLTGVALTVLSTYLYLRQTLSDPGGLPGYPATFLGVFGIIIGFQLCHSLNGAAEALDVTPTSPQLRTAAMCLTALVPFTLGVATLIALLSLERTAGPWTYGTFSAADRFALLFGELAIAGLGGPLLGIAVARWVHPFWALPILVPVVYVWAGLVNGLTELHQNDTPFVWLRMLTPYTYFLTLQSSGAVVTWRGSPWFFLGWQLCLCALMVIVALLRGAGPRSRRRLRTALLVVAGLAVTTYVLAATGGLDHAMVSYPGGGVGPL